MKKLNLKLKDHILLFILPFIAVILIATSILIYLHAKDVFMDNYNQQKEQIEANVVNTLQVIDSGFAMLETTFEPDLTERVLTFKNEFERAGGDPDRIDLKALKAKMGENCDLVIIDSETTIIQSTIPGTLGFNFDKGSRTLGDSIKEIMAMDSVHFERFSTNMGTGYLSMFAFIPSDDHNYVLEVAYYREDLGSYVNELKPANVASKLIKSDAVVVGIRIYDVYGYEYRDDGPKKAPSAESRAIVERAEREKHFEITEGNLEKSYRYIDLKKEGNLLLDNSKTVEIVYDTRQYTTELKRILAYSLAAGAAVLLITTLIIVAVIKRSTQPITILSEAAGRIAAGDYSISAKKFRQDEIGELTDAFNSMAARIRKDFEEIEYQKAELEQYNKNLELKVDERTIELVRAQQIIESEKKLLESILDDTLSGYWDYDIAGRHSYFSSGYKKMLGYEDHELGSTFDEVSRFLLPGDKDVLTDCFIKHVNSHGAVPFYNEVRFRHRDGHTVWVIFAGHVTEWDSDGNAVRMIGCQFNISDLKLLERSLNEERELLKAALLSMGDAVITTDIDGKVRIVNRAAEKLTGRTQEETAGKPFKEIFRFAVSDSKSIFSSPMEEIIETGKANQDQNYWILLSEKGTEIPIENSASPIRDENGCMAGAILVFRDYSEKKEKQDRIEYLSIHDQLTGLYNRRYFEEALVQLDAEEYYPLAVAMLDVNGLKLINDAFGHAMGDLTLQRAAFLMKETFRRDHIIARFGGDEFVVLMPKTGQQEAEQFMARINAVFETELIDRISISVSSGWEVKSDRSQNIGNVFKLAEDYMYRRKLSESRSMHYRTIDTILKTLHGKSEREKKHSERVGVLCEAIASAMKMTPEDVKEFRTIGLMHDIGKIAIDLSILDKPGKLDEMERAEIERHPELGYQILRSINEFSRLAEYTLSHHERWDGGGYPRKLKGKEIPLEARIIAIADAYDSMTSDRAYRKAMDRQIAVEELKKGAGTQFDPYIVKVFVEEVFEDLNT